MNTALAEVIGSYLTPLPWMDVWGGMSRTVSVVIPNDDNRPVFKKFPVGCNTSLDQCKKGTYISLLPDSDKRAVAFFEDTGGSTFVERSGDNFTFNHKMTLVVWLNLSKFKDPACGLITSRIVASIIKALPANPVNSGVFTRTQIMLRGELPKTPAIFGRYTLSEPETQYLLFPFDYFALAFDIKYSINQACYTDVELATEPSCA